MAVQWLRAKYVANVSACLRVLTRLPCMSLSAMLLAVKSFLRLLICFHFSLAVTASDDSLSLSLIHCVLFALACFVIALCRLFSSATLFACLAVS